MIGPDRNPDGFDRFRRRYVSDALADAADAMPPRKAREFRRFLKEIAASSHCDSGSDRNGEKPSGFECEASQSGPAKTGHRPNNPTIPTLLNRERAA